MHGEREALRLAIADLAARTIQRYARGLCTANWLTEQLLQAASSRPVDEEDGESANRSLEFLAWSLCGQILCEACRASEESVRELAFENLRNYLSDVLTRIRRDTGGEAAELRSEALQQALIEIFQSVRKEHGGPKNPAAFFKWARVILCRQLSYCKHQAWREDWLSLEEQCEPVCTEFIDEKSPDPLDTVLRDERRAALKRAISTLRNPHYRAVLLQTFFGGWKEQELAALWQVRVQEIYLWRFRALQALRKQPGVIEMLRHP